MMQSAPLVVQATTKNLVRIREFVKVFALQSGLADYDAYNIALAVDEACANLIQHAYRNDSSKAITVNVTSNDQVIQVEIADDSPPFDPRTADLPDMRRYFIERRHHGLGILLMSRVMDSIEYHQAETADSHNLLVLVKHR